MKDGMSIVVSVSYKRWNAKSSTSELWKMECQ